MPVPGVTVTATAVTGLSQTGGSVGTLFLAGITELGPLGAAPEKPIRSLSEFVAVYGGRVSWGTLYDAVDAFFRSGGSRCYVSRVVGPGAALSSLTLYDRAGTPQATLTVRPKGPGAYGTRLSVQVLPGTVSAAFQLLVFFDGIALEQSGDLTSPAAAVEWAANASRYVTVTDAGSATAAPNNLPATAAAAALSGGTDDRANITDSQWAAALAAYDSTFGAGIIAMPGRSTSTAHSQLMQHGVAYNRQALLDGPPGASASTLVGLAATARGNSFADEFGTLAAPWLKVPGTTAGTSRLVPASVVMAGLIARRETAPGGFGQPAAGAEGVVSWALDLGQAPFTEVERAQLNDAGINVFRQVRGIGDVVLYSYRTLDLTAAWRSLNHQLLRLQIVEDSSQIAEQFMFDQIDGRGQKIAEWGAALSAMLQGHWDAGGLFGTTAEQAYRVDVGPGVNTAETLQDGKLRASLSIRMSPFAEYVEIEIVKVPITESLVA